MEELDQYRRDRIAHADAMRTLGVDPYGAGVPERDRWEPTCNLSFSCMKFAPVDGKTSLVPNSDQTADSGPYGAGYGRIVLHRDMGNLHFITIRDHTGDVQIALSKKTLSEQDWKLTKLLDLGDIVYFEGRCAPTKKGEPTVWVTKLGIGAKSTAPPPAKHEGMTDIELRYRKRYVDLWSNPDAMAIAQRRAKLVFNIREFLHRRDFVEVETPILQTIPGGAAAKPFTTHHNALDIPMFMRIAPELYLKRLLVGGMPRVYEIGRNFRNEGLSPRHNPEFTALEVYEAFSDHEQMASLVEDLICRINDENGRPTREGAAALGPRPWRRAKMVELVAEKFPVSYPYPDAVTWWLNSNRPEDIYHVFEEKVAPEIKEPTFVTHFPASIVPLAKDNGQGYALAWELIVNGQEIGCGYSELNDPIAQFDRLKKQLGTGDEAQKIDHDFLEALAVGMPPAGGVGIGIDRLVMWLTGATSVRDVILFPTMRPQ